MFTIDQIKVGDIYQHKADSSIFFKVTEVDETGLIVSFDISRKRPKDVHHMIEEVEAVWSKIES